ncbi:MAG: AAA family ATPase [Mariprofundaceae bacterium]
MNARTPHVMAVASGKGGVGKTFLAVHLAARAAARGERTLLIDADLGLANVDVMLGLEATASIRDLISGQASAEAILTPSAHGFDVLPGGSGMHELTSLDAGEQRIVLDALRDIGRNYARIIIDAAAGIGENVLYFVSASESALIVVTPDPTSLTDAYALIKVLSRGRGVRRFLIAVNQADELDAHLTFRRLLSVTDRYLDVVLDFVGFLPREAAIRRSIRAQRLLAADEGAVGQRLERLLDAVLDRPRDPARAGGLQFFWEHSLQAALEEASPPPARARTP